MDKYNTIVMLTLAMLGQHDLLGHCYREVLVQFCSVRVYCTDCIRRLAGESIVEAVRKTDEWRCFVCATYDPKKHGLLNGKREWRANLESLFQESPNDAFVRSLYHYILLVVLAYG